MGLSHLSFLRDWKNPADFPTVEPDEATVRADLQYHPDAIKNYINETLIPSHDALTSAKHSHDNKTALDGITADDIAKWRGNIGTFRINVTYSGGGVYSADKTFDEIKAAYDAGQQPYVVDGTVSNSDTIYTLSLFLYDESSAQGFADFKRHLISEDVVQTETLRICSYTLASGSNIELQVSPYNGQGVVGIQSVEQTATSTEDGGANIITVTKTDGTSSTFTVRNGSKGSTGAAGRDGYTPVRGTDYWTADDIATIQSYIDEKAATLQTKSITDSGGHFTSDTVEGALQEIGAELAGINTLLGSGIQISFTIDDGSEVNTFSAVSGETWKEWVGTSRVISETSGLTLYCFSDDGIIFADEAGVNAVSLDGSFVHGNDEIVSGATYTIISYGG